MYNKIRFSKDARGKLLEGVLQLSNAVSSTLGPAGRNVIIQKKGEAPISTKDGVTVAKSIKLQDPILNIGVDLVKEAAIRTNEVAGDGTTTSTVLAKEIFQRGITLIDIIPTVNSVELKKGIDQATEAVFSYLEDNAIAITSEDQLAQVARISANNDVEVGNLVSTALEKVGQDGIVTVEESKTGDTYLEVVEGMQLNRGYKSPYFVTDNNTMQAVLQEPLILVTDDHISQLKPILGLLESVSADRKSLLIIADDVSGEALSGLIVNKMQGTLKVVAVKAPEFGERKKDVLRDIAILTGATLVSKETGTSWKNFNMGYLGSAAKVTVGKEKTTIIDAKGDATTIEVRVDSIKNLIDNEPSIFEKENLQNRLAALVGGVCILHVGGSSEIEMKEKRDRVEDALHATRAAIQEGVIPGGGVALLRASRQLFTYLPDLSTVSTSFFTGVEILRDSLEAPIRTILSNAGIERDNIESIIMLLLESQNFWYGFSPLSGSYVDMFEQGIIDPKKVTRLALQNAVSVAGTMLVTEAVISIEEDEKENNVNPMDSLFN